MGIRMESMEAVDITGRHIDYRIVNVGVVPGSEAFLIVTDRTSILYDSGFGFCGAALVENIRKVLGDKHLDYILETHSHYDHILGSAHCIREWPDVKVVASRHTAEVIVKDSARRVMRQLDSSAAELYGFSGYEDLVDGLRVDIVVSEGDVVQAGEFRFIVHEYPGHTFCSIGFHCPDEGLLLSCETLGFHTGDEMMPAYLVGYRSTLDSIDRALELDVTVLLVPHTAVFTGDICHELLLQSRSCAVRVAEEIVEAHDAGMDFEGILGMMKERHYTEHVRSIQPEDAFDTNAKYMIPMILKEFGRS